jgi:hypothetical protein
MGPGSAIMITLIVPDLVLSFPLPGIIADKKWELCYNLRHAVHHSDLSFLAAGSSSSELYGQYQPSSKFPTRHDKLRK